MSKNRQFRQIGIALFGETYKQTLARRLGVSNGVITRMCQDGETIKPHYWVALEEMHHARIKEIQESLNTLTAKSPD